ncbi:diiron oxygenase [Paraburkholderia humisilvae]|uniref:Uncharacterized protein n=1 Tax=Paraburkholderia humisilvae TaxID=627669 RepID=A0A6J5D0R2_9BURK|nr:diiron oxygenase [Paraburkholderia humisilvae]CAB3746822.1 hypothetical protein LMG29542_00305 [Paraburkholderia humisilvae]
MNRFKPINHDAHLHYLHPNRMRWEHAAGPDELLFLSQALIGDAGQEKKAIAYLYKELSQLAELEMHVATVLCRIVCEMQAERTPLSAGDTLYHALSCFAAEEINHANSFYQYVRHLSGRDIKLTGNLFRERVELYSGNESPLIKLAALCSAAYVGESVITVFERRLKVLDPMQHRFLTQLLHFHGLDEARHIQCDHAVFDDIVPALSVADRQRMHRLIDDTESLNTQLAIASAETVKAAFDLDYTEGNAAARTQLDITLRFREIVQSGDLIRKVDDGIDEDTAAMLTRFSSAPRVHAH